jgi:ubiquinone/menaquinone biosynthesis C-methylase UbiE
MKKHLLVEHDILKHDSVFYREKAYIYDLFSQAEDYPGKITKFIKPVVKNKIVLDLGCGTGKFIPSLAPQVKKYFALDISADQLAHAKRKANNLLNVQLIQSSASHIPLDSNSVDIVMANWLIGSIHNIQFRKNIIKEANRVLKRNGLFYISENDIGGKFKNLIENSFGNEKTKIKLGWLERVGFKRVASIKTFFKFRNLSSAKNIFREIYGGKIASNLNQRQISHNVAIFRQKK